MNSDRRAILSLIAMGRITPREAERLLAVASDRDEVVVAFALLVAAAWILLPHAHEVFAGVSQMFGTFARLFSTEFGGML